MYVSLGTSRYAGLMQWCTDEGVVVVIVENIDV